MEPNLQAERTPADRRKNQGKRRRRTMNESVANDRPEQERAPTPRVTEPTITAADLLRRIKTEVLAEPLRLDMGDWVVCFHGERPISTLRRAITSQPACGTVGCLAGWGMILLRHQDEDPSTLYSKASDVMSTLLSVRQPFLPPDAGCLPSTCSQCDAARVSQLYNVGNLFSVVGLDHTLPGTLAHAEAVARRIDTYLANHPELESRVIDVATRSIISEGEKE
jgi:hypothetical protein